jgi:hypothetical protein
MPFSWVVKQILFRRIGSFSCAPLQNLWPWTWPQQPRNELKHKVVFETFRHSDV